MTVSTGPNGATAQVGGSAPAPKSSLLTDLGNAERLVHRHGKHIRFAEYLGKRGRWLVWDNKRWVEDHRKRVDRWAQETVRAMRTEANALPGPQGVELVAHATRSEGATALAHMMRLAQSQAGVPVGPGEFDRDLWLLNGANGTLNRKTRTLRPHDPGDLITKLAPVPYEESASCPLWDAFLDRIMGGDAALVAYLQRAAGYALTGATSEDAVFLLIGRGANGKSTFLEVLRAALGDYARQTPFATFLPRRAGDGPREDIARLRGARFVTASEVNEGLKVDEALIKQLTGGDTVAARGLYQETVEFVPTFKVFLASNHEPVIEGADEGIRRRIRKIPFAVTIREHERDYHLQEKLLAELPGILAWAVRGCYAWQDQGLADPPAVQAATTTYLAAMDTLGRFLEECCDVSQDGQANTGDLANAYKAWCHEQGETPKSAKQLAARLKSRACTPDRTNRGRFWRGVAFKAEKLVHVGGSSPADQTQRERPE